MSEFNIFVHRTGNPDAAQNFWVTIEHANGQVLFTSEMYSNRVYAVSVGEEAAARYDGNLIDET